MVREGRGTQSKGVIFMVEDHITEADYMASLENWTEHDIREDIAEDRERRLHALKGRYVIACDGKRNQQIYLQDKRISSGHNWTKFLSNAISFSNRLSAQKEVAKLKYNNPRVMIITAEMKVVIAH
jgi:hypothetical protein